MSRVVLRPAMVPDLTILTRLIRDYFAFDHLDFDGKAIRLGLRELLKSRSIGRAFVIVSNSKPVGYTILIDSFDLEFGGRVAFVTDLYLEAPHRRLGIGTEIMKQLEHFCRERGIKTIELQAERRNRAALSFYRRLGFRRHDRVALSKFLKCP
jgi:GNAT superfamily N-acetyltransferase